MRDNAGIMPTRITQNRDIFYAVVFETERTDIINYICTV